jgi:hypothetical protein
MQRDKGSAECVSHVHYSSIYRNHQVSAVKFVGKLEEIAARDIYHRRSSERIYSRNQFFIQFELIATATESYPVAVMSELFR